MLLFTFTSKPHIRNTLQPQQWAQRHLVGSIVLYQGQSRWQSFVHPSLMAKTCLMPRAHKNQIKSRQHSMGKGTQSLVDFHATHRLALQCMTRYLFVTMIDGREKGTEGSRVERSSLLWVGIPAIGAMFESVAPLWWVSVHGSLLPQENTVISEAVQIWPHPSIDTALWTAGPDIHLLWGGMDGTPSPIATFFFSRENCS